MDIIIVYALTICYFAVMIYNCRGYKWSSKQLVTAAIICAMTIALRMFYITLPTTGRVTLFSVLPIMLLSIIYDKRIAFFSGLVVGTMAVFLSPPWVPVHWAQFAMEHLVCYSCLALTSIFGTDKKYKIMLGGALALIISIAGHVFAGVVFFGSYAWEGYSPWLYSIVVNVPSHGLENLLALIALFFIPVNQLKKLAKQEVIS